MHNLFRFDCVQRIRNDKHLCVKEKKSVSPITLTRKCFDTCVEKLKKKIKFIETTKECVVFQLQFTKNWMMTMCINVNWQFFHRFAWTILQKCQIGFRVTLFCTLQSNRPRKEIIQLIFDDNNRVTSCERSLLKHVDVGTFFALHIILQNHLAGHMVFDGISTKCRIISTMFCFCHNFFRFSFSIISLIFSFLLRHVALILHAWCCAFAERAHDAEQIKMTFTHNRITRRRRRWRKNVPATAFVHPKFISLYS